MEALTDREKTEMYEILSSYNVDIGFSQKENGDVFFELNNKKNVFFKISAIIWLNCWNVSYSFNNRYKETESIENFENIKRFFRIWLHNVKEEYPYSFREYSEIKNISPSFYSVFKDAIKLKNIGFIDISGMTFRKALEIISKDFLIKEMPMYEDFILSQTIGKLLNQFYTKKFVVRQRYNDKKEILENIMPIFKFIGNTFKIGNDFVHYERKLEGISPDDMKTNIDKIIEHISKQEQKTSIENELDQEKKHFMQHKLNK